MREVLQNKFIRLLFVFNVASVCYIILFIAGSVLGLKTWSISGESMVPTLQDGDTQINIATGDYEEGDIVCIKSPTGSGEFWVKRVIGVPGDTVEVWGNYIEVNGVADDISKKYNKSNYNRSLTVLLYNEYFVAGDNREHSYDSRFVGPIEYKNILSERLFSF